MKSLGALVNTMERFTVFHPETGIKEINVTKTELHERNLTPLLGSGYHTIDNGTLCTVKREEQQMSDVIDSVSLKTVDWYAGKAMAEEYDGYLQPEDVIEELEKGYVYRVLGPDSDKVTRMTKDEVEEHFGEKVALPTKPLSAVSVPVYNVRAQEDEYHHITLCTDDEYREIRRRINATKAALKEQQARDFANYSALEIRRLLHKRLTDFSAATANEQREAGKVLLKHIGEVVRDFEGIEVNDEEA